MSGRKLIVNADDLGWTPAVNEGIFEAHRDGVVTSATLMVNAPGAVHAARAIARPELAGLGVGLHVALTGGGSPTLPPDEIPSLVDGEGCYPRYPDGHSSPTVEDAKREVEAQLERFERLVGRAPTHLDSHHHVHREVAAVGEAVAAVAAAHRLPVRGASAEMRRRLRETGIPTVDAFEEGFFAEGVTLRGLLELVGSLSAGVSEIMCHPGRIDDALRASSSYVEDRVAEIEILTDPAVRRAIAEEGVELVDYRTLAEHGR